MSRAFIAAVSLICACVVLSASTPSISSAERERLRLQDGLPPGYTIDVVADIQWPAEIQCADDGRCFVASVHDSFDNERGGIYVVYPDKTRQRIYTGPSYGSIQHLGEKGLTGLALHPRFNEGDERIFFYWSIPDRNEVGPTITVVSSIRADGSDYRDLWVFRPPGDEYTNVHVAGGLVTYSESTHDYLFVAIGNYDRNAWSRDLAVDQGKIHRFEIVGDALQVPSDNPFVGTPGASASIWASGFRNPFRMTRDPATGKVYVNENGRSCSDRVYLLVKGGDYGWPTWDNCNPGYGLPPIYEFVTTMGITDIEVYHGPIPGWEGKVFICGFNTKPLYMLTVAPNGTLTDRQSIVGGSQNCVLALGTRADGALLYSRQTQFGLNGQVFAIVPITPGPRISAALTTDSTQPAAGQRIRYTLDVSNLSFTNNLTATIPLPGNLAYLGGSTFGGATYVSATHQIRWTPALAYGRSLRAGFDAITGAPPGAVLTVTAHIVDRYGQETLASAPITVGESALDVRILGAHAIQSGQPITYQLLVRNRSISDTTFALTSTLPGEARFVRDVFPPTLTYTDSLRAALWQRPLKADRQAMAAMVVSATLSPRGMVVFTTTAGIESSSITTLLTKLLVNPFLNHLPILAKGNGAPAPPSAELLAPDDNPFGRYGTPPGSLENPVNSGVCQQCHNATGSSIYAAWSTSAHGYGAIDPVFKAALHNASQQVKDVERWCTQCHQPGNWLDGHPINARDTSAITCAVCHRMVDSDSAAGIDQPAIVRASAMSVIPPRWKEIGGNGALIVDHNDVRRGLHFLSSTAPHSVAVSPLQGSSALCGACHSVYAPHLARDSVTGEFVAGSPDIAGGENPLFLQSTYPEWLHSQYATAGTQCQTCHMPEQDGYVASPDKGGQPREVPSHHFAGGNLFILDVFDQTGALADTSAQRAAVTDRLSRAATITSSVSGSTLTVSVTCRAGHKCPTGYEEGRAWVLQVEQLDADGQRIACSGCWNETTRTIDGYDVRPGDPGYDPELTVFGIRFGITGTHAFRVGMPPGESFNLALNNTVRSDTRIPPCGWDAAQYAALGIAPTTPFAPGSCTATAQYQIHPSARLVVVRLLHWSHTTPYLEFLRDVGGADGTALWNAWQSALTAGRGRPVAIAATAQFIGITPQKTYLPAITRGP